jgi:hypothetical protein
VQRVRRKVPQLHHPGLVLEVADRRVMERERTPVQVSDRGHVGHPLLPSNTVRVHGPLVTRFLDLDLGRERKRSRSTGEGLCGFDPIGARRPAAEDLPNLIADAAVDATTLPHACHDHSSQRAARKSAEFDMTWTRAAGARWTRVGHQPARPREESVR